MIKTLRTKEMIGKDGLKYNVLILRSRKEMI